MVLMFWLSAGFIAYVYAGYPALLAVWARIRPKPGLPLPGERTHTAPSVSIVIAARNEGDRLAARIENLLNLDYPAERVEVIVVSDGSTDDTLAVLRRYQPPVEAVAIEASGKAVALNAGAARARNELLVFTDARQTFARDALIELTRPFADPRVGAVSGELVLDGEASSTIGAGVGIYWRFEKGIRQLESAVGSTVGATGAIYAMRRSLWEPLPAGTILDDVLTPMRCVLAGYRTVFNGRALAFDRVALDAEAEGRRKRRTLAGNYQILALEPALLVPWRNPVWMQYVSHKVGRLLVPYALIGLMVSSTVLAERSVVYAAALAFQCGFYLLAGYGAWLDLAGRRHQVQSAEVPSRRGKAA
jgi:cellulose synthase/poly-beta-1,6-N-acetylglucosamine synthase-like glycosyltransferase